MSRTRVFFLNTLTTGIYQVIVMIVGIITPRIMLLNYGSEMNGLVSSLNQFIVYFNLVEAGLAGAAVYALYKPLAQADYKKINSIISAAKRFYMQSGYIFLILLILLATMYPIFIDFKLMSKWETSILVMVLGARGVVEFFSLAKYRVLLTADQKVYMVSIASSIYTIINMIIIVLFANLKVNIIVVYAASMFAVFSRNFILMFYVKRKYSFIDFKETPDFNSLSKRWDALYMQLLNSIQTSAPILILTVVSSLETVSIFTVYNMIIGGINGILNIFINGLSSSFGNLIATDNLLDLQRVYKQFEFAYYTLITIVYGVSFVSIMPFIDIYTNEINDINYHLPILGFLFVLNGLLMNIKTPQGMLVISAGMYKETRRQTTIQGCIIIILGVILGIKWGAYGVIIASCCSNLYRTIDLIVFTTKHITQLPIKVTIFRWGKVLVSIYILALIMRNITYPINNFFIWMIYSSIGFIIISIIQLVLSLIFEREMFISIIRKFIRPVHLIQGR